MKIRLIVLILGMGLILGCDKKESAEQGSLPEGSANEVAKPVDKSTAKPAVEIKKLSADEIVKEELYGKPGQSAWQLDGLSWVKGDAVKFLEGHVYVVEFWATWCPPCRTSIPHLTKLQKQYKDSKVTIIGITNEKDAKKIEKFVADQGDEMDYVVAIDADRSVGKHYMGAFGARGIPTAFIVNGQGKIAWKGHPMDMDSALEQIVAGTYKWE